MSLQITQQYEWLPTKITGCVMWLDGADTTKMSFSGNSVVSWIDKSGFNNNATAVVAPTYSSSNLAFNGTATYMTTPYTSGPSRETFFAVSQWTGTATANFEIVGGSVAGGRGYGVTKYAGSNTVRWFRNTLNTAPSGFADTPGVVVNTTFLTSGIYDGTNVTTGLNGSNQSATAAVTGGFNGGITRIGAGFNNGSVSDYFQGNMNEIIIYNRDVTTSERQEVEGYLAWKWNVQSLLPSSHPYKNASPFQNTYLLPTVPRNIIRLNTVTPSVQFNTVRNQITANVFSPLSLSNFGTPCVCWYDAQDTTTITFSNDGDVVKWADKSVNGYDLSNYYAGFPKFSNADGYYYLNNPVSAGGSVNSYATLSNQIPSGGTIDLKYVTVFMVYKQNLSGLSNGFTAYNFGALPNTNKTSEANSGGFILETFYNPNVETNVNFFGGGSNLALSNIWNTPTPYLPLTMLEYSITSNGPTEQINYSWFNGNPQSNLTVNQARTADARGLSLSGLYFGSMLSQNNRMLDTYELIVFSGTNFPEANRLKVEGYLAWKYNLRSLLPADHPYRLIPPLNN